MKTNIELYREESSDSMFGAGDKFHNRFSLLTAVAIDFLLRPFFFSKLDCENVVKY